MMKTIKVKYENWKKLTIMKVHLACSNLDEVVERLLKIAHGVKRADKLKVKKK